jgi:lipoyl(octanoyl) transferase
MSIRGELWVERLGVMAYGPALDLQREVARARIAGTISEDVLLLVEHPPVVTLGRSAKKQHLLASPELLAARGVEQFEVERGGDVTFHGPGQLVGYPIIDLKRHRRDLHWYLRQVEEALIVALADFGIAGERSQGQTGAWTQGRKIASIGVHARDWVTWHGFALNVTTDLSYFDLMVPCGIQSVVMTSISREMRELREMGSDSISNIARVTMKQVEASVVESFGSVFELAPRDVAHLLGEAITPA